MGALSHGVLVPASLGFAITRTVEQEDKLRRLAHLIRAVCYLINVSMCTFVAVHVIAQHLQLRNE